MRRLLLGSAVLMLLPSLLAGQASQFGIRGLGQPGRATSIRALGTGGAFAPMDELSSLNPAAIGGLTTFTATFTSVSDYRTTENVAGTEQVRSTRFPLLTIGGPIKRSPWSMAISLSTYLNRDYARATLDTLSLRDAPVPVFDTVFSRGSVSDFRFATSYRLGRKGGIGIGVHLLSGSTRNELRRTFFDTAYASGRQTAELAYSGVGISAGIVRQFGTRFVFAGSARYDGSLSIERDSASVQRTRLPMTFNGGVKWRVLPKLDIAAAGTYRSWDRANAELVSRGAPGATSTIEGSFGLEYATGRSSLNKPIRAGIRYATLPFYTTLDAQATEIGGSVGSGILFGNNRAGLDAAVEYLRRRDGTGRRESAVVVSVGVTVRP